MSSDRKPRDHSLAHGGYDSRTSGAKMSRYRLFL
jgi:hypothetical protein